MSAVVCYHHPCVDGVFAALVAREALRSVFSLRFIPLATYYTLSAEKLHLRRSDTVYLLDITGSVEFVQAIASNCTKLIVIDHHLTAWNDMRNAPLPENVELHFDLEKCAATLALEYFAPKHHLPQRTQDILKLVEDSDLWRMELPETAAFRAGFHALRWNFDARKNPAIFDQLLRLDLGQVLRIGQRVHSQQVLEVQAALSCAFKVHLGGRAARWGQCLAVEGTQFSQLRSHIGNKLAEESLRLGMRGIGIVAYSIPQSLDPTMIKLSFRSVADEDTSEIVTAFGGGGHQRASSCSIKYDAFLQWKA